MKKRLAFVTALLLCACPSWALWILRNVKPEDIEIMNFTVTSEPAKANLLTSAKEDLIAVTISKETGDNVLSAVLEFDSESGLALRCPMEATKRGEIVSFTANIKKENAGQTRVRVSELQGPPIKQENGAMAYIDGGIVSTFYLEDYVEAPAKEN